MSVTILWPGAGRRPNHDIEIEAVGEGVETVFGAGVQEITDEQWASCDGVVGGPDLPVEIIDKMTKCRIFVRPAVGFDNVDLKKWGERGIPVCNTPDYGTMEVADHAIALMLTLTKGIAFHNEHLRAEPVGNWRPALNPFGQRMSVLTFGVLGLGRIGTAAALRAKAFGMDVVFYDPYLPNGAELALNVRRAQSVEELVGQSDVLSIHAPLTDETRSIIDADVLAAAKRGIIIINTARGPIIDIDALHDALESDQVLAAGLDVLPEEPASLERRLIKAWHAGEEWIRDRLVLTPHSAFFTPQSIRDIRAFSARTAARYLRDGRLENCVNEEYLAFRR
ncbi:MAG: C-terminal binding protein [Gammaproteobacteria bacterium]|jgi:lactate dehydrogenase-like 2-hydroxyacid dehydrogenase